MATRYDTNPVTGQIPGVLRHDVIAPSPFQPAPSGRTPEWLAAYDEAHRAALRGEKADRAAPGTTTSITEIADNAFSKAWKKHNGDNQ